MTGLVKPKKFNIEDTNIALLGSDLEKNVRQNAAEKEEAWKVAGKAVGVEVWRIEKFKVVPWPKERFGRFYSGDSYIILRTYYKTPEDKKFSFDVHFWLGKDTSQDEAGTAAYKTVELDDLLGGVPVQHREVQDHESELFLSYFPKFHAEDGGVETGFKHVKPAEYRSRLLQVKGVKTRVVVREVEKSYKSLNSGDVFLLDAGMTVMQWNGVNSNPQERRKGAEFSYGIQQERNGTPKITVYSEGDGDLADFWQLLGGEGKVTSGAAAGNDGAATNAPKRLFRLTDTSGRADFKEENTNGKVRKSHFDTKDVFVFDAGMEVFVWIGKGATANEKRLGIQYAQKYLNDYKRPAWLPISRVIEGAESEYFTECLDPEEQKGYVPKKINANKDAAPAPAAQKR